MAQLANAFLASAIFGLSSLPIHLCQIPPEHARSLTVYHLNPASAGALPVNMDTGDVAGDLYFYLGQFLLPIECANASSESRAHFDCDNPERVDPNRVVTKVDMIVDSRTTTYSACNLCNGTDPFTQKPCANGTYVCDCFGHGSAPCDRTKVGNESIAEHFAPHVPSTKCSAALDTACGKFIKNRKMCSACLFTHYNRLLQETCMDKDIESYCPNDFQLCTAKTAATAPEWACWDANIPRKTGGFWYSTLKEGMCNKSSSSCGWEAKSTQTVHADCLKDKLMSAVEAQGKPCFTSCGHRNVTSTCWISCFFDTVLGPDARHSVSKPLGGMPLADIKHAWTSAFSPEQEGGCKVVDMPDAIPGSFEKVLVV
jgi:hypothetical protein